MTENETEFFSKQDASRYLGICISTLDKSGIPRIKIGKRVLYRKETIDQWLAGKENPEKPAYAENRENTEQGGQNI